MTSHTSSSVIEICTRVKNLGLAASKRIRIYGQEFEVVSDPFPHEGGIAVHVKTEQESRIRILQLPAPLVRTAREHRPPKAA